MGKQRGFAHKIEGRSREIKEIKNWKEPKKIKQKELQKRKVD
jgi:hypothetical protein